LWPHERSLVKNLENKRFVLLGVNTDQHGPDKLKAVMDKEQLPWRSFADPREVARGATGRICGDWCIEGTRAMFVIDHKGVIRHKWLGGQAPKLIDEALEKLIEEAEGGNKK
jgi:peroxiredoxin